MAQLPRQPRLGEIPVAPDRPLGRLQNFCDLRLVHATKVPQLDHLGLPRSHLRNVSSALSRATKDELRCGAKTGASSNVTLTPPPRLSADRMAAASRHLPAFWLRDALLWALANNLTLLTGLLTDPEPDRETDETSMGWDSTPRCEIPADGRERRAKRLGGEIDSSLHRHRSYSERGRKPKLAWTPRH